jgi:chorismate dehydratase
VVITAVSYLNTKPMIYGLLNGPLSDKITLNLDSPAVCASRFKNGDTDLALVPVGSLVDLDQYHIIGEYCIGSEGRVRTVCLFSEVPVEEIERIYLDYQSRTSVELIKILARKHWKISVEWLSSERGFESKISGKTAGLIIGDRAIGLENEFPYVYDLSEIWRAMTGLPFVFACWVSKNKLDPEFEAMFNHSIKAGIDQIDKLVYILPSPEKDFDLKEYFKKNISYQLDDQKRKALNLFLSEIQTSLYA